MTTPRIFLLFVLPVVLLLRCFFSIWEEGSAIRNGNNNIRSSSSSTRNPSSSTTTTTTTTTTHMTTTTTTTELQHSNHPYPYYPDFMTKRPPWDPYHGWWMWETQCRSLAKDIRQYWQQQQQSQHQSEQQQERIKYDDDNDACNNHDGDHHHCSFTNITIDIKNRRRRRRRRRRIKSTTQEPTTPSTTTTMVHTELIIQRNDNNNHDVRREQIPILSFLVTQHPSVKLNILVNEQDAQNPPHWLQHLLHHPTYGQRLQITLLDFKNDLQGLTEEQRSTLADAFKNVETLANKSDIRRYAVLYQYGGLWFDTDTFFISDVRPLMNIDFVYVAGAIMNGAVMGTSVPQSNFMKHAIDHATTTYTTGRYRDSYYRFAHDLFHDIDKQYNKKHRNRRKRRQKARNPLFLKFSGCLFESGWGHWAGYSNGPPNWDSIWSVPTTESINQYFQDTTNNGGPFSMHWHGHWSMPIQKSSLGSVAHANYVRELQLDPTIFMPADEPVW